MSNRNKKWSVDEDKLLKENLQNHSYMEIAQILERPLGAIENRVRVLGLTKKIKRWTEQEMDLLKKNYGKLKISEMAKKLNRGTNEIVHKAVRLGLSKKITENQRQRVIDMAKETVFTNKQIAQEIGMSEGSVNRIIRQNRIKRKGGAKSTNPLLKGFQYKGKGNVSKYRYELLYAYHNTCWDCKKTFVSESDLHIHHDLTQLPVKILVLCKKCHGKRHNRNFKLGSRNN